MFPPSFCNVKSTTRQLVVCSDALKALKDDLISVEKEVKGSELVGLEYETCFPELKEQQFTHKVVAWEDVDATESVNGLAYRTGHFAADKLIVAEGYKITAADKEALRDVGILLSDAMEY